MMKRVFISVFLFSALAVALCFTDAFAMWAKTYGTTWSDGGALLPQPSGNCYAWMTAGDPSATGMRRCYLLRLDTKGAPLWTRRISIGDYDWFVPLPLSESELLITGTTKAGKDDPGDIVWAKFTVDPATGAFTPIFQKRFGGARDEDAGVLPTEDGGFLLEGSTTSYGPSESDRDILLIKVGASGGIQWAKVFHYGDNDTSAAVAEIPGGYVMTANVTADSSILAAKLDSSGEPQWAKLYGPADDTAVSAVVHPLSGDQYLLLGSRQHKGGILPSVNLIALKLDGPGNVIWAKEYEASGGNLVQGTLHENGDGTLTISGNLIDRTTLRSSIFAMKLQSDGSVAWAKEFSGGGNDIGVFARGDDGTYYLSAASNSFTASAHDMDILYGKADSELNLMWSRTFGGPGVETGTFQEYKSRSYLTGMSNSWGAGDMDVLAVTLDTDGGFPGCPYCKEVSLPSAPRNVTATTLPWEPLGTSLVQRTPGDASDTIINVAHATVGVSEICYSAPADQPEISVIPASLAFGGLTVGASSEKKVMVKNAGTADLVISSVSGPNVPFSIVSGKDKCSGKTLKPSGECEITFRFAPSAVGAAAGGSVIASNDPNTPSVTVDLAGTGMEPTCVYSFTLTKKENISYRGMTINLVVKGTGDKTCPQPPPLVSSGSWITTYPFTSWRNNQGSAKIKVMPNSDSWQYRTGEVTIGQSQDNKLIVGQQGTPCKLVKLVPVSAPFTNAGALAQTVAVSVMPGDCSWTALTADPWVNLVVGIGPGPGNVVYDVLPNDLKKARVGTITVYLDNSSKAKKVFTIRQAR